MAGGHAPGSAGSYRDVLRHRPFVSVIGLNALFIFAGFSGFELLPVYAIGGFVLDVSPNGVWIGAAALCALGGALAFVVETTLPARARRTPVAVPASV